MDLPPPPMPVDRSSYYAAFCVFKITYMRSEQEEWDNRIMEALKAAHPLMPQEERQTA